MPITNRALSISKLLLLPTVFVGLSTPAIADAIDGDWCAKVGRHLKIDGSKIKTPGGNNITGNYERHSFSYVVPKGEALASKTIHMQLQSEDLMLLTLPDGLIEKWNRCQVIS